MNKARLQQQIWELQEQLAKKDARINWLEEQFRLAQHKQFGASSEGHSGQGQLFDESESEVSEQEAEPSTVEGYTRNKPKRKPLPANLPRETITLDIPEEDKICDCCQGQLHKSAKTNQKSWNLFLPR